MKQKTGTDYFCESHNQVSVRHNRFWLAVHLWFSWFRVAIDAEDVLSLIRYFT